MSCARFDFDANCVEEIFVRDFQAERPQTICELTRQAMNAFGDCPQSSWAVIHSIHRGNHSKKNLRRANVARRFVATDVLLSRLQRKSISGVPFSIV